VLGGYTDGTVVVVDVKEKTANVVATAKGPLNDNFCSE